MKSVVRIRFDAQYLSPGPARILKAAACGPDVTAFEDAPGRREKIVFVTLERTDPRVEHLRDVLLDYGCPHDEANRDVFTEEELSRARLLVMQSNGSCRVDGGVVWGVTYDLSAGCPICGTGARQTSSLFFRSEHLSRLQGQRAAATQYWHHLVDDGIAAQLARIGATGLSFQSVWTVSSKGEREQIPWKQMIADKTLPPMSPRSTGFERDRECGVCRRNGYFTVPAKEPVRFVYREADIGGAEDVNLSWENVGYARLQPELKDSLLAKPWMLVSPRVRRVFVEAGITCFDWTPIGVEAVN